MSVFEDREQEIPVDTQRAASPGISCVSMKSNNSMNRPPELSDVDTQRAASPGFSCVSMKSNNSMNRPPELSDAPAVTSVPVVGRAGQIINILFRILRYLFFPNHISHLQRVKDQHKTSMKNKYESVFEGIKLQENQTLLNKIYTQLYIIEGESEGVNEEHEVLQMEKSYKTIQDTPINCNYIFNPLCDPEYEGKRREKKDKIKTVLTKGIAGIGKTVSVQKFILDWVEEKANQDVDFMFVLPFRELNLIKDHQYSLHRLLLDFYPELQDLDSKIYDECKVVFIFDGLDESRISLMFSDSQKVSDVTEISTVSVLMSNLMKGDLLPSALIWITTRPAAANQIPSKYINRVTEIQGFNDPQKEEYFRKRISDEHQASRIISHIRRARSLHIMCHIPVFCWISATVLQNILKLDHSAEIPQTLTEMYIYFLIIQTQMRNQKYEERDPEKLLQSNREVIVKLAEVAFNQLMKGNVIFYEEDLRESSIDVTDASISSVSVLMSNLLKGDLLPSALIWITTRPAAANQIPSNFINRVTEIQGFNDPQKEEYFRKRISDEHQASRIISHIRRARSLHIMCHIPVFCWISATVLQNILKQDLSAEIPQTLTEMYIYFLLIQTNMRNQKYEERDPEKLLQRISNREVIVKLAELAFNQLMMGNVMFYEEDLRESGIDVTDASVYSGICTEIFREESVIYHRKVYSFVHLSFQEFFAALYVFYCYLHKSSEILKMFLTGTSRTECENVTLDVFLKGAMNKALDSKNGHLDLFLRFLHGISLDSNQGLLQDVLMHTENNPESIKRIIQNLKRGQKTNVSPERWMNLTHCLIEMKDNSVVKEMQAFLNSKTKRKNLSLAQCSTLANMILMSEEVLDELNLKHYKIKSKEGRWRLLPAVRNCRKAFLAGCNLSDQHSEIVASALQSSNSPLRELDLSNNHLQDSGGKLLAAGLKSPNCQLDILRLSGCLVEEEGCAALASALSSNLSHLRELDLSDNDMQDSGVKLLSAGLKNPNQLNILRLSGCLVEEEGCAALASALSSNLSHLRELDLSDNDMQDSGVKLLSAGLKNPNQLNILRLSGCMVTAEGCTALVSALSSNPSHLRELDLSYNHPGESGVKLLSETLNHLDKLNVDHGGEFMLTSGLHKYACDLTLDTNTANDLLILSDDNRKVTNVGQTQSYPDHPDRFEEYCQVLSVESLTGRCYWETEWSGDGVHISVSYKEIKRKGGGNDSLFGHNVNSWSLICSDHRFSARHNKKETDISAGSGSCKRVGVFLDESNGTLSFYSVSDKHKLTHLHTFTHTFTHTLHAGFGLYPNSSVSLCDIKHN
ncbi:NACHT, LRR and PYD domains-containing protein 14-like isoform X1 [Garra rufa]|uniref:NACHT, LRR and PYD domains-containing protein 14-like isoform X1 n=1 Tax=Garra rufa TaxID=137080 RepID=UPI003CCE740A